MLVNAKELLAYAKEHHFAIPSANFVDEDSLRCHLFVAESLGLPLILAHAEAHQGRYLTLEEAAEAARFYAGKSSVPVVLHLDHGASVKMAKRAIDSGFTSVMIDASMKPLEENISLTNEVLSYARPHDVSVEAEIGHVGSGEKYEQDSDTIYTAVSDAVTFEKETGVDSLAVSIGTAHGLYKGTPKINFDRLHELAAAVKAPLVLHGGSSSGDANLQRCAAEGIAKINIYSDFMVSAAKKASQVLPPGEEETEIRVEDYYRYKDALKEGMRECLAHYYLVFGTQKIG